MYARLTRGRFPPGRGAAGLRAVARELLPALGRTPGYRGSAVLAGGPPGSGVAVEFWDSEDAVAAASADQTVAAAHARLAALGLAIEARQLFAVVAVDRIGAGGPSPRGSGRSTTMREVVYAMRFEGQAEPMGGAGNVLRAATRAPSGALTSTVGPGGLTGTLEAITGDEASFASEVIFTGETGFQESGTIAFGAGHALRFTTVGQGYLGPSADPARRHGAVAWRVDGGEGQFAGATGLITSNFFVDEALGVVDHHFGVLLLP